MDAWDKPEAKDKPNKARNHSKWASARRAASRKFGKKNSYVKNMWAVRQYNKRGGEWKKSMEEQDNNLQGKIDWEKVLNEYGKHKAAYKESMMNLDDLNPYVFVWSETEEMPMPNPTVDPNDLESWNAAKRTVENSKANLIRFEKTFEGLRSAGKVVTADTLARLAPAGVSADTLAMALGVTEKDRREASKAFDLLMAKRINDIRLGKSMMWGMEPLRKDAPFAGKHTQEITEDGEQEEESDQPKGMQVRWDAQEKYMQTLVTHGTWDSLRSDDQKAIESAHALIGQSSKLEALKQQGGEHDWTVHTWLRPQHQRFYEQGALNYLRHHQNAATNRNHRWGPAARARALNRAIQHVQDVEEQRKKTVLGIYKPFKLTERYKHDKVQPGTIAARNIKEGNNGHHDDNEIDIDSKVMIPQQGQHGPTSYDQHDTEVERQKMPRAAPGASGREFMRTSHSVSGIDMPELYSAMKGEGLRRQQPQFRGPGFPARQAKRLNDGLRRVLPMEWKDWQSWDRRLGETDATFLTRKLAEFFMLKEGTPNPSAWRTVFAGFMNGVIVDEHGKAMNVTGDLRDRVNRAAARIAVNNSVIRTEQEWGGLNYKLKFKYLRQVMHEMHKNAHPEQYGTEAERRHARARLEAHRAGRGAPPLRNFTRLDGPQTPQRTGGASLSRRRRAGEATPLPEGQGAGGGTPSAARPRQQGPAPKYLAKDLAKFNREIARLATITIRSKKLDIQSVRPVVESWQRANKALVRADQLYRTPDRKGVRRVIPKHRQKWANALQSHKAAMQEVASVLGRQWVKHATEIMSRLKATDALQRKADRRAARIASFEQSLGTLRLGLAKAIVSNWVSRKPKPNDN